MKRSRLAVTVVMLLLSITGISVSSVAAQYEGSSASCESTFNTIVTNELDQTETTNISITVNNIIENILNVGNSPSGRYDRLGYPIVEIDAAQALLPVVGQAAGYLTSDIVLALEDTDFEWGVKVNSDAMFLTDFPVYLFPAGSYYMTLCDARIFRVEIPEDYAAEVP